MANRGPSIDLRSDTVTRPSPGMRAAMAEAEVGDEVYDEDPTVDLLEAEVAALLGHEAGLFVPSGSMSNQLALRVLVPAGAELLCEAQAHVVRAELGAAATLSGITTRTWTDPDGVMLAERPLALMAPDAGPYLVSTAAIAVENSHNFGGGAIQSLTQAQALRAGVADTPVRLHLDGARIWNAAVSSGDSLVAWGSLFDTVSVCLSKGLGAPIGSVLVSNRELIEQARVWRKRFGGGMRQVGVLAAAGRYALAHHRPDLAADHRRAATLAQACAEVDPRLVAPERVDTNIVLLNLSESGQAAADVAAAAADRGIRISILSPTAVRLVTHRDLTDADVERAAHELAGILSRP